MITVDGIRELRWLPSIRRTLAYLAGVAVLHWVVHFLAFPGAGAEYHAVFSHPDGGCASRLLGVWTTYLILGSILGLGLSTFPMGLHWAYIGITLASLSWWRWHQLCSFRFASPECLRSAQLLGCALFAAIVSASVVGSLVGTAIRRRHVRVSGSITPRGTGR